MAKQKEEKKTPAEILARLEKKYGLEKIQKEDSKIVPSGSYTIDIATGVGGYVKGKLVEIYGPESSGKSTIVLEAIAQFQKYVPDRKAVLVDYEYAFDKKYARSLGVDIENLVIYQPDNQENGYDMIIGLLEESLASIIVIDSHTAAIPQKIIEGEMGDATMAIQARNNSKFLGKIKGLLDRSETTMLAVSQTRKNIGGMGDLNIPTGGDSWKFYSDMRFKVWKSLDKDNSLNKTTLDVVKNKCAEPFGKAEFDIAWGTGIDTVGEIISLALDKEIISLAGSWYSYGEVKLGQGVNGVKKTFDENVELFEEIKNKVLEK